MQTTVQTLRTFLLACRPARATMTLGLLLILGFAPSGLAQTGTNPLTIFKNYFITGDYVVGGWVQKSSDGTFATGTISIPDPMKPAQSGLPTTVPVGADIVAAYLYWGTVEGNQSAFQGQQAFFNGYSITGDNLLSPNGTVSWSSGGCIGGSQGSKTMRIYRADVRRYLPVDTIPSSPTFGALLAGGTDQNPLSINVRMADSGSSGNTQPNALGATLVIIYRVLNPPTPLNAVVLYDGAYAPSNTAPNVNQTMVGFYQPNSPATAKLTHIVANGQPNKGETVSFVSPSTGSHMLPSLYTAIFGANSPPFPGLYGMWDNPTWSVGSWTKGGTSGFDPVETTTVVPASTGSGCVDWGAMIFSTTVQDSDGDGLLDVWETPDANGDQGYIDAVSKQWVALPGADPLKKDIFVELDYLTDLDGSATQHSHLPKEDALKAVGGIFANQKPSINVHFDLGPGIYQGDPYVITYPVPIPPGVSPPPAGTGGNAISEGALLCTDDGHTPPLCAFPGQPAAGWKGDFLFVRDTATMPGTNPPVPLGNFQPGRGQSYHYVLFGHSLGEPRSYWSAYGAKLADPTVPQLVSIQNTGNTAKVTIQSLQVLSPQGVTLYPKPGDCPNALIPACSDANSNRVTVTGALGQPNPAPGILSPQNLNATYLFTSPSSTTTNNITTTTFNIATSGVPDGTYNFGNEPELGVAYLGPTSSSGHSDFGGGGDSAVTFGLWGADDQTTCQPDPSQPPGSGYCNNQVGTTAEQTGTLLHELGHSLTLTHGGTYYTDPANPSLPSYEVNCKPNFLTTMSYLFQVRGFVDGGFDYSGQGLAPLNETSSSVSVNGIQIPALSESLGIGSDGQIAAHLTRWYSKPNALDNQLQTTTGGRYAKSHCDGTPIVMGDPSAVRVDGALASTLGSTYSAPLDWNNDLTVPDAISAPGVDLNYNAITGDSPFSGLNEWQIINPTPSSNGVALQQISARGNAFAFSGGGGTKFGTSGGTKFGTSGGIDFDGGSGTKFGTSGGTKFGTSGGTKFGTSGGVDQNEDTAASTVDPPSGLTCSIAQNNVPACVSSSPPTFTENAKMVPLSWTLPGSTQIRFTYVYRAVGSFPTTQLVMANFSKFTIIKTLSGSPPAQTYTDPNVKNTTTYTYFVTDKNKQGALSGASTPLVVFVKF